MIVFFVYSISKFHKKSPTAFSIFSFTSVFCTLPFVLGDWMSFSMFNFQQGLALLVMAIAVNYSYIYFETKKMIHLVCSTILIYISTSFYQAHIVFYVCSIAIYLFLMIIKEEVLDIKEIYKNILVSIVVFTIAFFSYYITDLFIRNYILNQYNYHGTYLIGWNNHDSILSTIVYIITRSGAFIVGFRVSGGMSHTLIIILFCLAFILLQKRREKTKNIFIILCTGLLLLSPLFIEIIFCFFTSSGRLYLSLTLLFGFLVYFSTKILTKVKHAKLVAYLLVFSTLFYNAYYLNKLYYNCLLSYKNDQQFASSIMRVIEEKGYESTKSLVFIGSSTFELEGDKLHPAIGSFFEWDDGNNGRIICFFNAEGYNVTGSNSEQIALALEKSKEMPKWPNNDSIIETDDFIIIKLSEPSTIWYQINSITDSN